MTYPLQTYKLPNTGEDIFEYDDLISKSNYHSMPLINLGFHHFIYKTKEKMSITSNLQTKKKIYLVVNDFEHNIDNYSNSLSNATTEYLKLNDSNQEIISRAFYKFWEILHEFNISNTNKLTYVALAEGPGGFVQSLFYYRIKVLNKDMKDDRYYGITLQSKELAMASKFTTYLNDIYPKLFTLHNTDKDNGDLTTIKAIHNFVANFKKNKKYADLVSADGGFEWKDENCQEQEITKLLLGEIITAIHVQAKGGSFVLKIFETYTLITIKLMYILSSLYEECHIHKPYMSRESNSEKYIICKNFKYSHEKDNTLLKNIIQKLENIFTNYSNNKYINDIFIDFDIPKDYIDSFKNMNIILSNKQQIKINKIVKYIKENNYFGDSYHNYKENQKKATTFWLEKYYPVFE
jgi:23S rRNA U2552 (ribose-2'-O)-methylase RlmE/FtsJ